MSRKAFRAVRKTRVSQDIIEQVRDLVTSGRLKPGDRLPSERELSQVMSVSRSSVREAVRAMESLGLIDARAGEGTFVASLSGSRGNDPLIASLHQDWNAQHKLFEVRRVIEPDLAALAARRATAEQIEKMRTILAEQQAQIREGGTGMKQDTLFHYLLAEATGNEVLMRIMDSLMDLLLKTREESLQHDMRPARSLKQHRAMLRAIEARNPRAAERLMYQHIAEIEELVFSQGEEPSAERLTSPFAPDPGVAG
ncbi:MAG TPA: FadR/GntR family transcriptional regulator [Candidatus Methylomirabilis sp.]|nr:FadR/GntR family transcriptional regulator [Candidatus Methylomirabilis sp.]